MSMEETSMTHPDHDDGLIHGHGWACSERGRPRHERPTTRPEPDHDEGLVHSHGWAAAEGTALRAHP
jgi:hypothetical protein